MRKNRNDKIYTPKKIAKKMARELLGENPARPGKVLDLCCGSGNLLIAVAELYKEQFNLSYETIFSKYIFGVDIDEVALEKCRERILQLAPRLKSDELQVRFLNFLSTDLNEEYDYIISNPPYIRIQDLTEQERDIIKGTDIYFGNIDLSLIFFWKAHHLLTSTGKVCFIMPNAFLKNKSGMPARIFFDKSRQIQKIIDFGSEKVFKNIGAYVAIFLSTQKPNEYLIKEISSATRKINYNEKPLSVRAPAFSFKEKISFKTGLATLADKVFISDKFPDSFERELIRTCWKNGKRKDLIFPYKCTEGKYVALTEKELKDFSNIFSYLSENKEKLLQRDKGKLRVSWFLFGRTQGINAIAEKKLIIPTLYKPGKEFLIKEGDFFIGGYAITPATDEIFQMLQSKEFLDALNEKAKPMPGGFFQISKEIFYSL